MRKSFLIFFLGLILLSFDAKSQPITFQRTYGGNSYDNGFGVIEATKGYFIFGNTSSFGAGNTDVIMIKTDSIGNPEWFRTFGSQYVENGTEVIRTLRGTMMVCGYTNNTLNFDYNGYLIEIDTLGNLLNESIQGGVSWDFAYSMIQAYDSSLYVAGETFSFGNAMNNAMLMKINPNTLDTVWMHAYGGDSVDVFRDIMFVDYDSTLLLTGETNSYDTLRKDLFVLKTSMQGDSLWMKRYADTLDDGAFCIVKAMGKDFFVGGYSVSSIDNKEDEYGFLCDSAGNIHWGVNFHATDRDWIQSCVQTPDTVLTYIKYTESTGLGQGDVGFIFYHNLGFYTGGKSFGGTEKDEGQSLIQTTDNGFAIVGSTQSFGNTLPAIYFIKTDSVRNAPLTPINITLNAIQENTSFDFRLNVYPVPANSILNVSGRIPQNEKNTTFVIQDLSGRVVNSESFTLINSTFTQDLDLNNISSGTYLLSVLSGVYSERRLIVIQK
ncbi:MAG: T9SS type A sorting domain-containing protein [Bacteroidota bacterium]